MNQLQLFKVEFTSFPDTDRDIADKASSACWETILPGTEPTWFVRLYGTDQEVYDAFELWTKNQKRGTVLVCTLLPDGSVGLEKQFNVSAKTLSPMMLSSREGLVVPEYEVEFDIIR